MPGIIRFIYTTTALILLSKLFVSSAPAPAPYSLSKYDLRANLYGRNNYNLFPSPVYNQNYQKSSYTGCAYNSIKCRRPKPKPVRKHPKRGGRPARGGHKGKGKSGKGHSRGHSHSHGKRGGGGRGKKSGGGRRGAGGKRGGGKRGGGKRG